MAGSVLLVLSGPVGGGKSSTARAVVERLRTMELTAVHIDLDVLYVMARQRDGFDDQRVWQAARRGASALAGVLFRAGIQVVVVEGNVFDADEEADLAEDLESSVRQLPVALQVSWASAYERVRLDPSPDRVSSRNPDFLKRLHDEYIAAMPYLSARATLVATDGIPLASVAESISRLVMDALKADVHES